MAGQYAPPVLSATRFSLFCALIAAIVFVTVAPTLRWLEFSSGSENLVVESVLEMHRGGPLLIPTLDGVPRTQKPPLPAWISAALVPSSTVAALSDVKLRDGAYRDLAWEVRWPSMVFSCLALLACGWIGRILFSDGIGLAAVAVMGSSAIFLRFSRSVTTDVHLMLWVTIANLFFAMAIFQRRRWLGCLIGGVAVGLALMSKGPVAIAQTVIPVIAFFLWRAWVRRPTGFEIVWGPILAASAISLIIAIPWPVYAMIHLPHQLRLWLSEIAQGGNSDYKPDPPWAYFSFIPLLLPWAAFFFVGLIVLAQQKTEQGLFVILLILAPIVVMSFFTEKNERYLLPMTVPAAIVCAAGIFIRDRQTEKLRDIATAFTWGYLLVVAIGFPIAGALGVLTMRDIHGSPWWSPTTGLLWAIGLGGCVVVAWRLDSSGRYNIIPASLVVMLVINVLFVHGYARTDRGLSDGRALADSIVAALPPHAPVWAFHEDGRFSRMPTDVTIYLDRIVWPTLDASTLEASVPQAVLVHCHPNQPMPPSLAGWRVIGSISKNEGIWRVCLPPGMPRP